MASVKQRSDGRWRARYRDEGGREHAKHFPTKKAGQKWLDTVTASVVTGQYVDPKAGKVTFKSYAETWRAAQVHRPSSAAHVETMLRRHAYPTLGGRPLANILPSEIQAWVKHLSTGRTDPTCKAKRHASCACREPLAAATVGVVHGLVAAVFKSAVRDRRLSGSPCEGIKLPKKEPRKVEPRTTEAVQAIAAAVPERYAALVMLAAGTGMRQGEALGLTVDRLDFLRRTVTVDRQLVQVAGKAPTHGPPKTSASHRTIPLPQVVVLALSEHLRRFPAGPDGLVFTTAEGEPIRRTSFSRVWRPAVKAAGQEGAVFHDLRHYYASLLIRHGESVKVVQSRLGHATAAETLDTYSHLWPDSEDRTRQAIDDVLGNPADSSRTADGSESLRRRSEGV